MGNIDPYVIVRKALPALYVALSINNPPALAASAALLISELAIWGRYDLELSFMGIVVSGLLNMPESLAASAVSTLVMAHFVKLNPRWGWRTYTIPLALMAVLMAALVNPLSALAYTIPLAYILILTAAYAVRYVTTRIVLEPDRDLRTVAGSPLRYALRLITRPRVKAHIDARGLDGMSILGMEALKDGLLIHAEYLDELGGLKRPRVELVFTDPHGLVRIRRTIYHPPIAVVPRTEWALSILEAYTRPSIHGAGELTDIREYVPGDPIRLIDWKKSAQLDKLVIVLRSESMHAGQIVLVAYTSSPVKLDRVGAVAILSLLNSVLRNNVVNLVIVNRNGEVSTISVNMGNLNDVVKWVLGSLENLNVRIIGGSDLYGILSGITRPLASAILSRIDHNSPVIVIGEDVWARPICGLIPNATCLAV